VTRLARNNFRINAIAPNRVATTMIAGINIA